MKQNVHFNALLKVSKTFLICIFALFIAVPASSQPPANDRSNSIDVRIPSESGGSRGIMVRITPPKTARYGSDAPVVISIPGGFSDSGFGLRSGSVDAEGFIDIKLNFPGGGNGDLKSGGTYDNRGKSSMRALCDVIRFALGKVKTFDGSTLADIVHPIIPQYNNVGLTGYSHGGNATLTAAGIYGSEISSLAWIVNWESPVGPAMVTVDAGGRREGINPAYNPDKGEFDFSSLTYDPTIPLNRGRGPAATKDAILGGLFFDMNKNGILDEEGDFTITPQLWDDGNGRKAFYAAAAARYAEQNDLFPKPHSSHLASADETNLYWKYRTGHYWFKEIAEKIPGLIFIVVAADVDHVQGASNHPHILSQYEGLRKEGVKFVRLNADRSYIEAVWDRQAPQAMDTEALIPLDNMSIRTKLQIHQDKENGIPRNTSVLAAQCELADRTFTGNINPQLDYVLVSK